jgi:hypothetical protein
MRSRSRSLRLTLLRQNSPSGRCRRGAVLVLYTFDRARLRRGRICQCISGALEHVGKAADWTRLVFYGKFVLDMHRFVGMGMPVIEIITGLGDRTRCAAAPRFLHVLPPPLLRLRPTTSRRRAQIRFVDAVRLRAFLRLFNRPRRNSADRPSPNHRRQRLRRTPAPPPNPSSRLLNQRHIRQGVFLLQSDTSPISLSACFACSAFKNSIRSALIRYDPVGFTRGPSHRKSIQSTLIRYDSVVLPPWPLGKLWALSLSKRCVGFRDCARLREKASAHLDSP